MVKRWSQAFIDATVNRALDETVWRASDQTNDEADSAIERVRSEPDSSLISAMVRSDAELPVATIQRNTKLILSGGLNEPQHVLTSGVFELAQRPEQLERVVADPELFHSVFNEVLRFRPPISSSARITTQDVVVRGFLIPRGTTVAAVGASANRDEEKFVDPDSFDAVRDPQPHFSFGGGAHRCAGSFAARAMVAVVAWPKLYQTLKGLRPLSPETSRYEGFQFRGLRQLPVTWDE